MYYCHIYSKHNILQEFYIYLLHKPRHVEEYIFFKVGCLLFKCVLKNTKTPHLYMKFPAANKVGLHLSISNSPHFILLFLKFDHN